MYVGDVNAIPSHRCRRSQERFLLASPFVRSSAARCSCYAATLSSSALLSYPTRPARDGRERQADHVPRRRSVCACGVAGDLAHSEGIDSEGIDSEGIDSEVLIARVLIVRVLIARVLIARVLIARY